MTKEYLIQLSANSYFWVFIVALIIEILFMFSNEYKIREEAKRKLGLLPLGISPITILCWTLFLISIKLR